MNTEHMQPIMRRYHADREAIIKFFKETITEGLKCEYTLDEMYDHLINQRGSLIGVDFPLDLIDEAYKQIHAEEKICE